MDVQQRRLGYRQLGRVQGRRARQIGAAKSSRPPSACVFWSLLFVCLQRFLRERADCAQLFAQIDVEIVAQQRRLGEADDRRDRRLVAVTVRLCVGHLLASANAEACDELFAETLEPALGMHESRRTAQKQELLGRPHVVDLAHRHR